jgi:NAD(P)-dependent dehydrogenase (short-subunit alcohol dehydrogenase family)
VPARAFVAGGSRGIGGAVTRALAAAGFDVAIGYRSREAEARAAADAVAAEGRRAPLIRGDVSAHVEELVDEAAAALGGLDAFVMCAVDPVPRRIEELGLEDFERTMRANAAPFVLGSVAAARHMEGGGRIVGLSATGAHAIRNPRYAPLGLAKGVIEAAVRFLAVSLAPRGIAVNAVAPGPTDTEAFASMAADAEELKARLVDMTPMGRIGTPEDAARLIAFLCSEEAGWVTGQLVFSDGGYSLV